MNNHDFNSDLESILAEFAAYSGRISGETPADKQEQPAHISEPIAEKPPLEKREPAPVQQSKASESAQQAEYYVDLSMLTGFLKNRQGELGQKNQKRSPAGEEKEVFTPEFRPSGRKYSRPWPWVKKTQLKGNSMPETDVDRLLSQEEKKKARVLQQRAEEEQARKEAQRSALWENRREEDRKQQELTERRQRMDSPWKTLVAVLFSAIGLFTLAWMTVNVHPDSGVSSAAAVESRLQLTQDLDVYINNAYADAMGDMAYIKKIYTIPESALAAPRPNPACFGETTDPAVIQAVIDDAAELLDGQKTLWSPDLDFYPGTTMQYYRDHSILVITWKEKYDERCCTMSEVKIAHGSQLRRRLAQDSYGSSVQLYASDMAKASNAIVASNADFYAFRTFGVTVFQRQLFRADPGKLDTCFFTSTGDMLFSRAGELTSPEQIESYIRDKDVVFSLSFGPVLVDNGELQVCESYPIGEIDVQYSRAGIGMLDELHYLLMTVNHTDMRPRAKVNEFGRYMYEKGCIKAYNLDGGQTSEIVMNGKPVNWIDFGAERTVSDIIYFATAIPESEWMSGTEVTP